MFHIYSTSLGLDYFGSNSKEHMTLLASEADLQDAVMNAEQKRGEHPSENIVIVDEKQRVALKMSTKGKWSFHTS